MQEKGLSEVIDAPEQRKSAGKDKVVEDRGAKSGGSVYDRRHAGRRAAALESQSLPKVP